MNILTASPKEDRMTFDEEVDRVLKDLRARKPDSAEYETVVKNLKVLCEARGIKTNRSVSTDALIAAGVNILGILVILNYEQVHVITTKAISLVFRGGRG